MTSLQSRSAWPKLNRLRESTGRCSGGQASGVYCKQIAQAGVSIKLGILLGLLYHIYDLFLFHILNRLKRSVTERLLVTIKSLLFKDECSCQQVIDDSNKERRRKKRKTRCILNIVAGEVNSNTTNFTSTTPQ